MKRISLLTLIVLTLVPTVSRAYYGYSSLRYRTRYSPYAFSYKYPSGLISGELRYTPYASSYRHSGLIPDWFRYSPYAFSYEHPSGLISDFWCGSYYFDYAAGYRHSGASPYDTCPSGCVTGGESADLVYYQMRQKYEENLQARDERIRRLKADRQEVSGTAESDGGQIIRQYLAGKNIDFQMNRVLRIDNRLVSADFLLRNKNVLIKYLNPQDVELIAQDSGYKKNAYQRHKQMWDAFAEQFRQQGGKIYQIESADGRQILEKLKLVVSS